MPYSRTRYHSFRHRALMTIKSTLGILRGNGRCNKNIFAFRPVPSTNRSCLKGTRDSGRCLRRRTSSHRSGRRSISHRRVRNHVRPRLIRPTRTSCIFARGNRHWCNRWGYRNPRWCPCHTIANSSLGALSASPTRSRFRVALARGHTSRRMRWWRTHLLYYPLMRPSRPHR